MKNNAEIERVLRENGLTDQPDQYDGDIHSWRCRYPDIYGPCDCFAELLADLTRVIAAPTQSASDLEVRANTPTLLQVETRPRLPDPGRGREI